MGIGRFRGASGALLMDITMARPGGERWYLSFFFLKMAGGASAPLVPLFVISVLGGGVGAVSIAIVSVSAATVPAFIIWGEYSDRTMHRRLPMVIGMGMMAFSFVIMGLSTDLGTFIAGNVMFGFFLAATVPTSTVLIMENNEEPEWGEAVGRFARISGMGWMIGMALGAAWFITAPTLLGTEPAMRTFMLICGVFSAVAYAMAMIWVREPPAHFGRAWLVDELVTFRTWTFERARHIPSKLVFSGGPHIIRKARTFLPGWGRDLDIYLVATFFLFLGIQVFYVPFPVMLSEEIGLGSSQIFVVYLASALAAAVMYAWAGREVDQLGNRRAQVMAWGGRAAIFPAFSLALFVSSQDMEGAAFLLVLVLNGAIGALFSIVSVAGITTALDLSPRRGKGEAVGAYNSVTGLGMIAGGLLGGVIASGWGYLAVFWSTAVISAVAVILLLAVRFRTEST